MMIGFIYKVDAILGFYITNECIVLTSLCVLRGVDLPKPENKGINLKLA